MACSSLKLWEKTRQFFGKIVMDPESGNRECRSIENWNFEISIRGCHQSFLMPNTLPLFSIYKYHYDVLASDIEYQVSTGTDQTGCVMV